MPSLHFTKNLIKSENTVSKPALGEALTDTEEDGLTEREIEAEALGLLEALGLTDALGDFGDGDTDAEGDRDKLGEGDTEADGLTDALGDTEGEADCTVTPSSIVA